MNELTRPVVRLWEYVDRVGGFPGKVFFCCVVVILVFLFFTWLGNRK